MWRATLVSNKTYFFLGNERMPSTEHHSSQELYQSLISPVQAAHCVLNHLNISWSKLSVWKKQRERRKLLNLRLELESNTGSYPKHRILNSQQYRGGESMTRYSLLNRCSLQCWFSTALNLIIFSLIKMCVNAGSTKGVKRFNRTSEKKKKKRFSIPAITDKSILLIIGRKAFCNQ